MKVLIVTAHPAKKGFTHKIAQSYASAVNKHGGETHIMNLYENQWRQEFLQFEDLRDIRPDETAKKIRAEITWATQIVFVFPVWWFSVPAVMKNFFDHNFAAGFAFTFKAGKPKGLLTGKTARIFTTADGPSMLYRISKPFFSIPLTRGILGFCGVKTLSVDIFTDRMKWKGTQKEREILKKVANRANVQGR